MTDRSSIQDPQLERQETILELVLALAEEIHDLKVMLSRDGFASRTTAAGNRLVEVGRLIVDLERQSASVDGRTVELPPMESALLVELATHHPGGPIAAEELGRRAWPERPYTTADDVRRHIYRLRRRLGDDCDHDPLIRNRRGIGYVLQGRPTF